MYIYQLYYNVLYLYITLYNKDNKLYALHLLLCKIIYNMIITIAQYHLNRSSTIIT